MKRWYPEGGRIRSESKLGKGVEVEIGFGRGVDHKGWRERVRVNFKIKGEFSKIRLVW